MPDNEYIRILLVEDDRGDARFVCEQLGKGQADRYRITHTDSLSFAVLQLKAQPFDIVLLDLSLPDSHGIDTIEEIHQCAPEVPIIVLSGASDEATAAVQKGAQDYLIKGEAPAGVLARAIEYAIYRKQSELKLTHTIEALQEANQQILTQQKSVIEEERLKVLLQMAGATSHELNQPIMTLLGTIEIMRMEAPVPEGWSKHMDRIENAGRRIADIVKKMSTIRSVDYKPYPGGQSIINLDQIIRVLAVEDTDADFEQFKAHMAYQKRIEMSRAASMAEARKQLQENQFDLVFLDYLLPDGKGLNLLTWMEKEKVEVPVIAITGHGDEIVASQMIKAGAFDYLPKANITHETLSRCIFNVLEKFQLKQEVALATQKVVQMATRDPLTGLFNRNFMNDTLKTEFERAKRHDNDLSCLLIDLDYFKEVNDTFGHHFGDLVLERVAQSLEDNIRKTDFAFRYGGEEFVVLLPQTDITGANKIGEKLRALFETLKTEDGASKTTVTVSVGVASLGHSNCSDGKDLLAYADKALYQAKARGRNRVEVHSQDVSQVNSAKRFKYIKERLEVLVEKTKKASVEALELVARDMGGIRFKEHNQRVVQFIELLGARMKFQPKVIRTLQRAAIFHDFTKVLLGDFQDKARLDPKETQGIKDHPYTMTHLMEPFDFFSDERAVLLWHHENWDGSGYPEGLKADDIPLGARLLAVVDALVAMTSQRPHREMSTDAQAMQELVENAGIQFDPGIVQRLLEVTIEEKLLDVPDQMVLQAIGQLKRKGSKPHAD
ncbi:MAG: diguanylate cyclase [Desulfatitalea sp.]|nr:diguanylate cyclase [Desulfatitalea sp.]NNK00630.1 diguanylate cyclase [Desulfatitalea sp.]